MSMNMGFTNAKIAGFLVFAAVGAGVLFPRQNDSIADCSRLVLAYQDRENIQGLEYSLDLKTPGGERLVYLGSEHTRDPGDPQFQAFERAWNELAPTTAFYEGTGTAVAASRDEAIRSGGEPGFVRFLAARDRVPMATLEPDRQEEIDHLLKTFRPEQVKLFYVLRIVVELRERNKLAPAELRSEAPRILDRFGQYRGLQAVMRDVDELAAAYRRYWQAPEHWWEAPAGWFDPLVPSSASGGVFTNEINQASSGFRNIHMFEALAKATLSGGRVFAVVGRDHIPMQAAALKCAIR